MFFSLLDKYSTLSLPSTNADSIDFSSIYDICISYFISHHFISFMLDKKNKKEAKQTTFDNLNRYTWYINKRNYLYLKSFEMLLFIFSLT